MPRPKKGERCLPTPDAKGYFRPYLGVRFDPILATYIDHRFNLGRDRRQAEQSIARLAQLWDHMVSHYTCGKHGPHKPHWHEFTLSLAQQIIEGNPTITLHRKEKETDTEYAARFNCTQKLFPFLLFVPTDPDAYLDGAQKNKRQVETKLVTQQEFEIRQGRLASKFVVQPVQGTFHQALDAYAADIDRTGDRLPSGELKPSQKGRKERVNRFKTSHANTQLALLNLEACSAMVSHWRNRPVTKHGKPSSRDDARHQISELFRFLRWLDVTEQFEWRMPRGFQSTSRRISKLGNEQSLSAIVKPIYTAEQLATINQHATPMERLGIYLGLNCAMGAAELGRLTVGDIIFHEAHPFKKRLRFESSNADTFVRRFRPKTDVFGEWLLWSPVAEFLPWGIERSQRIGSQLVFVSEEGSPLYMEESKNAQVGFANQWKDLLDRVTKSEPNFPRLPFGTLRDTLPDLLRQNYDGGDELASLCLAHGSPSKADTLLECYSNKPFGRLHNAIRDLFAYFKPLFEIENPTEARKHYLPIKTHQTAKAMLRAGERVADISQKLGVHPSTIYRIAQTSGKTSRSRRGRPLKSAGQT